MIYTIYQSKREQRKQQKKRKRAYMAHPDPNREVYTPQKIRIKQSYEDFFPNKNLKSKSTK